MKNKRLLLFFSLMLVMVLAISSFAGCNFTIIPKDNQDGDNTGKNPNGSSYNIPQQEQSDYSLSNIGQIIAKSVKSAVEIKMNLSDSVVFGSGFIVDKDENNKPYIITNYHVIDDFILSNYLQKTLRIKLGDKADFFSTQASVLGYDADMDIAVLYLNKAISDIDERIITWGNSRAIYRGQRVYAIGNALGYGTTVSQGIISVVDEVVDFSDSTNEIYHGLIRHDASLNSGNSGGMLINEKGEVIGVNTYTYTVDVEEGKDLTVAGENMSLALTSNLARAIYERVRKEGSTDVSAARKSFGNVLGSTTAALDNNDNNVLKVTNNINALNLKKNDIITAIKVTTDTETYNINVNDFYFDSTQVPLGTIFVELSYYYSSSVNTNKLVIVVKRNGVSLEITTNFGLLFDTVPVWVNELADSFSLAA